MDIWHIRGGNRLEGECPVQGSKNASLPVLTAAILAPQRCEVHNVPRLRDVDATLRILRRLGCQAEQQGNTVCIDTRPLSACEIPHSLMSEMRSSVVFLGALIARCGEARLSLPGGCKLGKRPIDLHLAALRQMGARIEEDGAEIRCYPSRLKGTEISLPFPSVGATENIMLAACGAKGETVIRNAAREPEITALQGWLRSLGAEVEGAGSGTVTVRGFHPVRRAVGRVVPDRIAAATYACAVAAAGGDIRLRGAPAQEISTVLHFLNAAGCDIINETHALRIRSDGKLRAVGEVVTQPYPGFPTDAQPLLMAALLRAEGVTVMRETIFENRFRQVPELCRLGADIRCCGNTAILRGVERLHGAPLTATDLRAGAAMIVAGLAAEGETVVCDDGHLARGYERLDERLRNLGADICLET